jgi:hypothetical protein
MFPSSSTSTGSTDLYTRLVQRQTVKASSNIYFATHIKYNITHPNWIWQLTVNYNSDIIWRASYWWDPEDAIWNQVWVKIIWVTNTNSTNDLVTDQFINDIYVLNSNISKTTLKTQITKNWYEFARNSPWNSNTSLLQIDNPWDEIKVINNVIYFWKTSWNDANIIYQLWNNSNGYITISQNKTILIIWWDLYINSNLYYTWNWMLWIIVLKDLDWNWWNVYINPNVTNIVWNIFAEKSVISYDWIKELDWETEAITLKNQLHIYWTLFSENTIGWSREATPKCPFYVNVSTCTLETAQKYDLNYLRRYYLIKDWTTSYFKPANNWKLIWWWTYSSNWNVTWFNTNYARQIKTTTDTYAKYPVIIEYNPKSQSITPPLFLVD